MGAPNIARHCLPCSSIYRMILCLFGEHQLALTLDTGAPLYAWLYEGPTPASAAFTWEHFIVAAPWGKVQGEISCEQICHCFSFFCWVCCFFFSDIYCLLDFAAFTAFSIIASETVTVPR